MKAYSVDYTLQMYLMKFGYLPRSDMETGALRTHEELQRAIKNFQRTAHLPLTGTFDDDTVRKMGSPRCGVPDNNFVLGPGKWQHQRLTYR